MITPHEIHQLVKKHLDIGGYSSITHIESVRGSFFYELNEFDLKTAKNLANKIKQYMARGEVVKYKPVNKYPLV